MEVKKYLRVFWLNLAAWMLFVVLYFMALMWKEESYKYLNSFEYNIINFSSLKIASVTYICTLILLNIFIVLFGYKLIDFPKRKKLSFWLLFPLNTLFSAWGFLFTIFSPIIIDMNSYNIDEESDFLGFLGMLSLIFIGMSFYYLMKYNKKYF